MALDQVSVTVHRNVEANVGTVERTGLECGWNVGGQQPSPLIFRDTLRRIVESLARSPYGATFAHPNPETPFGLKPR